jgi:hypothetical protein
MRPMLFYPCQADHTADPSHHLFLEKLLGISIETYPIFEHRNQYDHEHIPEYFPGTDTLMPSTCWCDIPDHENPIWPKLHFRSEDNDEITFSEFTKFVAGGDDLFLLTLDRIQNEFGNKFSPPGDW